MPTPPMWRRYLRFWGANPRADIDAEIDFHIEELERHYRAKGLSAEQAQLRAVRRFGSRARVQTECVTIHEHMRRAMQRREWWDALSQDGRDGWRALTRSPGFTCGAALILAIGIGFNATTYSFNKALLFPSLPIGEPSRIVRVWAQDLTRGIFVNPLSVGEVADLAGATPSFSSIAAYIVQPVTLTGGTDAERIVGMRATSTLFPLLQVAPALGRAFNAQEAIAGTPVAVISHRAWRNRFDGDPHVVGRDVHIDGRPLTIVGVMPEAFWYESRDVEVWLPLPTPRADGARDARTLMAVARLAPGASAESALAEVQTVAKRSAQEHPSTNTGWDMAVTGILPFGPGEKVFFALVGTLTGLLLAAACAHIANLLLARGMDRRGEVAIRAAIGAGRSRIIRQLLVESVALAFVGGLCSMLVAYPLIAEIRAILGQVTPFLSDLTLDRGTLIMTAGLSLVACVLFGLVPAVRLSSVTAGDTMKQWGGTSSGRRRRPLAGMLVGVEVAVATIALIITLLFSRAAEQIIAAPLGFDAAQVLTFRIEVPTYKYPRADSAARLLTEVRTRAAMLPGVRAAGAGMRLPLYMGPGLPTDALVIDDRIEMPADQRPWAVTSIVTPGYFESLSIKLVDGRMFESRDAADAPPVAVVSRSMARTYFPNQSPLGRRLRLAAEEASPWLTIVGVVDDVRPLDPTSPQVRQLYLSLEQRPMRAATFFVATHDDPASHLTDMRSAVRSVDADLPMLDLRTLPATIDDQLRGQRLGQRAIRANAVVAGLLAITGIYSVVAFAVARRRREIAIRMALGGTRREIVTLLLRQAMRPAVIGLGVGLGLTALVTRATSLLLYGVNPLDPAIYGLAALTFGVAAAAASCFPAVRATRMETAHSLRAD